MKCVIVGNGTSLSSGQLDRIIGIPSIACNRINLIYPRTRWRPTIYVHPESVAPDLPYIHENIDLGIECHIGEYFAAPPLGLFDVQKTVNVHWIKECHHHLLNFDNPDLPDEWHLPQLCSFGGSVNMAMQIAYTKGYDELILIGCDLIYRDRKPSHFDLNYEHGGEQPAFYAARNALHGHLQALNWLRRKSKNIQIFNATLGGNLEIWQRKSLADVT